MQAARVARLALVGGALATAGLTANVAGLSASDPQPSNDLMVQAAATALAAHAGLPYTQAESRILEQQHMFELTERLAERLGPKWAGARIDQLGDGRLIVASTDRAAALAAIDAEIESMGSESAAKLESRVTALEASHSFADTSLAAERLVQKLGGPSDAYEVVPQLVTNNLEVTLFEDPTGDTSADLARAEAFLEDPEQVTDQFELDVVRKSGGYVDSACYAGYSICDRPLRGGVQIQIGNPPLAGPEGGTCTAGFVVKSKTDSKRYILTAGHCLEYRDAANVLRNKTGTWGTAFVDNSFHAIGPRQNHVNNGQIDAGIIRVLDPAYWQVSPGDTRVLVQLSGGTRPTASNQYYDITSLGSNTSSGIPSDGFLCYTGTTTDTQCFMYSGQVAGTNFVRGQTPTAAGDYDMCQGDSGGPVYAYNKGYGILQSFEGAGYSGTRTIWNNRMITVQCVVKGGYVRYTTLYAALNAMNVEIIP
jgi:V8-like Glu-specific endopeptidase